MREDYFGPRYTGINGMKFWFTDADCILNPATKALLDERDEARAEVRDLHRLNESLVKDCQQRNGWLQEKKEEIQQLKNEIGDLCYANEHLINLRNAVQDTANTIKQANKSQSQKIHRLQQEEKRQKELREQIAALHSTGQQELLTPEVQIRELQTHAKDLLNERDTAFERIGELQTEATDYRRTIREQNVVIEEKSKTNMNAPVMLEDLLCKNTNQIRIIHDLRIRVTGLLNGRATDKARYEDLFAGFRKKARQLMDDNDRIQKENSKLTFRCNAIAAQEISSVKAELDSEYIESLKRKIARQVGLGDNLIKENEALVMRIESLEGVIRNALREIKGVFFLTSREFIRRLEEVL